jgi:glycosyltransferase involved in cell wall biosynthesis
MIEAMALAKPVVAFDLPFSRELLGEAYGLLSTDIPDFARKLARLIESPSDQWKFGAMLESRARKFDASVIAEIYRQIYETCQ